MREHYIKRVQHELRLSPKRKREILRDLNEAFASALEHGETEQQVIERLGSPREFAETVHEELGIAGPALRSRRHLFPVILAAVFAAAALAVSIWIQVLRVPQDRIGQGTATTAIRVAGAAMDPVLLLALLGVAALVVAAVLAVRFTARS